MTFRPYEAIKHDLEVIASTDLCEGIWAKVFSRCGIVRNVDVVTVSECKRFALVTYSKGGKRHQVSAADLLWFRGKPVHRFSPK